MEKFLIFCIDINLPRRHAHIDQGKGSGKQEFSRGGIIQTEGFESAGLWAEQRDMSYDGKIADVLRL